MRFQNPRHWAPLVLAVAATLLFVAACDFSGQSERTVGGVNITELFASPSASEIDAVHAEWENREVVVEDFDAFGASSVELSNGTFEVTLASHTVEGIKHMGAFIVPEDAEGPLAVLVYAHGGDQGVSLDTEVFAVLEAIGELAQEVVVVVPSYRSETLRSGGTTFSSDGDPSPWDWDVDDSLALMQAALEHVPQADEDRIAVVGLSRGALVGQLMAARDDRIDAVVSFFGPTDFYSDWVRTITEDALTGTITPLPGVRSLVEQFVLPLQEGNLTADEVRHEMARRSIVHFVDLLPPIQLHHGEDDHVVPVSQATLFRQAMEAHGRSPSDEGDFQYFIYPSDPPYDGQLGHHDPGALPGSIERAAEFLFDVVVAPGEAGQ